MLVKMVEVLVKIAVMMMAPGSAPAPPEARGRGHEVYFSEQAEVLKHVGT